MVKSSALIKLVTIILVVGVFMQLGDDGEVSWAIVDQDVDRQTVPSRTPTAPPPSPTDTPAPPPPATNTPVPPPPATNTPVLPFTATNTPELTPTATGTPISPTPSTTPISTTTSTTATIAIDTNVYDGPGLDYTVVGSLKAGDIVPIVGRNTDSSWWQILFRRSKAWISDSVVTTSPVSNTVPVVNTSPLDTSDSEPSTLPSSGGGSWLLLGGAILLAYGALLLLAGTQVQR